MEQQKRLPGVSSEIPNARISCGGTKAAIAAWRARHPRYPEVPLPQKNRAPRKLNIPAQAVAPRQPPGILADLDDPARSRTSNGLASSSPIRARYGCGRSVGQHQSSGAGPVSSRGSGRISGQGRQMIAATQGPLRARRSLK
jgi:hypothetical protein